MAAPIFPLLPIVGVTNLQLPGLSKMARAGSTRWWSSTQRKEEDTQRMYGEADKEREYREGGRSASEGPEMEVRGAIGEI